MGLLLHLIQGNVEEFVVRAHYAGEPLGGVVGEVGGAYEGRETEEPLKHNMLN